MGESTLAQMAGIGRGRRALLWIGQALSWLLTLIGAVLLASAAWISRTFGQVSIPQLLMNLPQGGEGEAADGDPALVRSFVMQGLALPLITVLVAAVVYYLVRRKSSIAARHRRSRGLIAAVVAIAVFIGGASTFAQTVQLRQYIDGMNGTLSLEPYYRSPTVLAGPSDPKNLVVVYLESMDDAFGNEDLVGEDLLTAAKAETQGWGQLDTLRQYPAAGWTMAGIIGTQCGVPPRPAGGVWATEVKDANLIGDDTDSYMPNATCLGDVLADAGYRNVYLGGASADFANKGEFLSSHGYDTIMDRAYWEAHGETEFSGWGLSDRRLFENAKTTLAELHSRDQPFSMTMLTLDNHTPVYDFGTCPQTSATPVHSAVRCQSEYLADLIKFMRDSGMFDDTVIMLMADHLSMPSDLTGYRSDAPAVQNSMYPLFHRFWSPDGIDLARRSGHQLHLYPTILELLDFQLENHQAGLGVSYLATPDEVSGKTLLGSDLDDLRAVFASPSQGLYDELWGVADN